VLVLIALANLSVARKHNENPSRKRTAIARPHESVSSRHHGRPHGVLEEEEFSDDIAATASEYYGKFAWLPMRVIPAGRCYGFWRKTAALTLFKSPFVSWLKHGLPWNSPDFPLRLSQIQLACWEFVFYILMHVKQIQDVLTVEELKNAHTLAEATAHAYETEKMKAKPNTPPYDNDDVIATYSTQLLRVIGFREDLPEVTSTCVAAGHIIYFLDRQNGISHVGISLGAYEHAHEKHWNTGTCRSGCCMIHLLGFCMMGYVDPSAVSVVSLSRFNSGAAKIVHGAYTFTSQQASTVVSD